MLATTTDGIADCGAATAPSGSPFPIGKKFRKIGQIFRNLKTGTALRSREYYSFPDRRYTSTVACASHPRSREKFPAAAKNAAKALKINIVNIS